MIFIPLFQTTRKAYFAVKHYSGWLSGNIKAPQDEKLLLTKLLNKEDGLVDLENQ